MDNSWIDELYAETDAFWQSHSADMDAGYAIFYSPVHYSLKIMIIGYNPGGGRSSFDREVAKKKRETHDYFDHVNCPKDDYPLARKMREIFRSAELTECLKESVKLNLYFVRSNKASNLKERKQIGEFCHPKVIDIIRRLQPYLIIAEGFKTFRELLNLLIREETGASKNAVKPLVRYASGDSAKIIGIRHPTGSRGVTTENLTEMGQAIKAVIAQSPQ